VLRLRRYHRIWVQNRRFRSNGGQLTSGPHQPFFLSENYDLSYNIKIWTDLSSVLSQCTRLTDGRTDGQTVFSSLYRVCNPCSAVKTNSYKNSKCVCFRQGALIWCSWRKQIGAAAVALSASYADL